MLLSIVYQYIVPLMEAHYIEQKKQLCKSLVDIIVTGLSGWDKSVSEGQVSLAEAQQQSIRLIRQARFGNDLKLYYWIIDNQNRIVMHPYRPDLERVDPDKVTDPSGQQLFKLTKEMANIAKSPNGGFIEYQWQRFEASNIITPKIAYLKTFTPWKWAIGTGIYIDDLELELAKWKRNVITISLILVSIACAMSVILSIFALKWRQREEKVSLELIERDKQFRMIFETSPYAMAIIRLIDDKFLAVNSSFESLVQFSKKDLLGEKTQKLGFALLEENYRHCRTLLEQKKNAPSEEVVVTLPDGEIKTLLCSSTNIDFDNTPSLLWMGVDITKTKILEEQLRQSQKMDVIGQLAGGVAHDFNNMLAGIMGNAEMLASSIPAETPAKQQIETIISSCEKSADLTRKLLAFSRPGKNISIAFDIHESINATTALAERSFDRRIQIITRFEADKHIMYGDPSLIQNALLNLAVNARDAMPQGGTLTLSTSNVLLDESFCSSYAPELNAGWFIEIDIADTGIGIPLEIQSRLFEPFFTTKPAGSGTGLGLSVVYGTIKEHHGKITVESKQNIGTIFKIYLPIDPTAVAQPSNKESFLDKGRGRILVVDDEPVIRSLLSSQLESLGYEVISAEDGEIALEIYRKEIHGINLVLLDMVMPKLSGIETFLKLKDINPDIKVIFCSGFSHQGDLEKLYQQGALAFLHKPYRISTLASAIKQALG